MSQKACLFVPVSILAMIAGVFQYLGELLDTIPIFIGRWNYSFGRKDAGTCVQARQNLSALFLIYFTLFQRFYPQNH